ncbi:MAG: NADH-quinone oxidoreductase subunit M, partial [Methylococcaceae bacterium]|nr:NADH-quinone oxidoreductase subunit M [Methylococcaceae bacterium]
MIPQPIPILSLLIWFPVAAGLSLLLLRDIGLPRRAALAAAALEFILSLAVVLPTDFAQTGFMHEEKHRWIPSLNLYYHLGVDGISGPLLPLSALLGMLAVAASWNSVERLHRVYFALLLVLQGCTLGVLCALDLGLFFLFWELTLVPIFFLIALWGIGPRRRFAATQYTLLMLAGGTLLLAGFSLLALNHAEQTGAPGLAGLSFALPDLLQTPMPEQLQTVVFALLLVGFAVKAPLFPFHVWLPLVAMEGPIALTALLAGIKLGVYGILRLAIPLAPQAAQQHGRWLAAAGIIGALYGALIALRQTNWRGLLAYSSVSHVGLAMIGISAFNLQGLQGAVLQLLNFTIAGGGAYLLAGFIHSRLGSTDASRLGGGARHLPLLASFLFVVGLAGMGMPGTAGFPAEHLILLGSFQNRAGLGLAALAATALGAAAFLLLFRRSLMGPVTRHEVSLLQDLKPREWLIALAVVLPLLAIGFHPKPVLDTTRHPLLAWLRHLHPASAETLANQQQRNHHGLKLLRHGRLEQGRQREAQSRQAGGSG